MTCPMVYGSNRYSTTFILDRSVDNIRKKKSLLQQFFLSSQLPQVVILSTFKKKCHYYTFLFTLSLSFSSAGILQPKPKSYLLN